jgi:hypothetical protein
MDEHGCATSHCSVKAAVDEVLNTHSSQRLKKACTLTKPLNQFLAHHFLLDTTTRASSSGVPLFLASARDTQAKNHVCMMAKALLGLTGACIHQVCLGKVLNYMWHEWDFMLAKLHDLHSILLTPQAVTGKGPGSESMAPLLTIHHLR